VVSTLYIGPSRNFDIETIAVTRCLKEVYRSESPDGGSPATLPHPSDLFVRKVGHFCCLPTDMAEFIGLLDTMAKLMGDYNAVKRGKVGKRVGCRTDGKTTGKAMRKLFK